MLGGQGAARWARDGKLDLRRHIPLTRNLGIEVQLCCLVLRDCAAGWKAGCRLMAADACVQVQPIR